jgi:hypothetical protein
MMMMMMMMVMMLWWCCCCCLLVLLLLLVLIGIALCRLRRRCKSTHDFRACRFLPAHAKSFLLFLSFFAFSCLFLSSFLFSLLLASSSWCVAWLHRCRSATARHLQRFGRATTRQCCPHRWCVIADWYTVHCTLHTAHKHKHTAHSTSTQAQAHKHTSTLHTSTQAHKRTSTQHTAHCTLQHSSLTSVVCMWTCESGKKPLSELCFALFRSCSFVCCLFAHFPSLSRLVHSFVSLFFCFCFRSLSPFGWGFPHSIKVSSRSRRCNG